jgi:microcystin-dependent protein
MSQPYVGQIRLLACNFAPVGHAFCNGQIMSIAQNSTLFNLIGTTYGGDGQSTFALPDLQGRIPVHQGSDGVETFVIGEESGTESVTLGVNQIPAHTHPAQASDGTVGTTQNSPANAYWNKWSGSAYTTVATNTTLNPDAVTIIGGSQPHDNIPPFQVINYVISLFGIYPSQN